jgi:ABC-2 type transport system permease protein
LNLIRCEFVSSIDLVESPSITKTVLLATSKHSKILMSPVRVSLNMIQEKPSDNEFNREHVPVAVLLEGVFTSAFPHRITYTPEQLKEADVKDSSVKTKMIVISDGDMMASYVSKSTGTVFPLGFDRSTRITYGNKNFLLNCIDYLCDDSNLLTIRAKELKIRMLDQAKLDADKLKWQIVNVVLPILLVLLYGAARSILRKRKYEN